MIRGLIRSTTALLTKLWTPPTDALEEYQQELEYGALRETKLENRILLSANPLIAVDDGGDLGNDVGSATGDGVDGNFHVRLTESGSGSQVEIIVNDQAYHLGSTDDVKPIQNDRAGENDAAKIPAGSSYGSTIPLVSENQVGDLSEVASESEGFYSGNEQNTPDASSLQELSSTAQLSEFDSSEPLNLASVEMEVNEPSRVEGDVESSVDLALTSTNGLLFDQQGETLGDIDNHSSVSIESDEIVFVDSRVQDYAQLIDGISEDVEVILVDPAEGGLQQVVAALDGKGDLNAIHLISHGSQGTIFLGSQELSASNIDQHSTQWSEIGDALAETGDIFLYGCDVAQGEKGAAFVSVLANVTDADVAASTDKTGAVSLGGNWDLEYSHGETGGTLLAYNLSIEGFSQLLDNEGPTATVDLEASELSIINHTTALTITFTEEPVGFVPSEDLSVIGGTLDTGNFDTTGLIWTANFQADDDFDQAGSVTLADNSYADAAGNLGGGGSDSADIDTKEPEADITYNGITLSKLNNTAIVSIEFTEDPVGFEYSDLIVSNGSLSGFEEVTDLVWTATFTAEDEFAGNGNVELPDGSFTDHVNFQNLGIGSSLDIPIDTLNPTVTGVSASDLEITDVDLNSGNFTLTVTFSESMDVSQAPVLSFPTSDENPDNTITFVSGVWTTTDATNDTYVATYSLSDADEVITDIDVQVAGALDVAGNTQVTSIESNLFSIDTENPTATVILGEDSLSDSNNTTTVSITFTEVPTGFNPSEDLSVIGGTLNTGSFDASNKIWTATFTADDGITGSGSVALADDSYTDAVLNMGAGGSDTLSIDTENPTVTGVSASDLEITDVDLNSGNFTLTVTFSESMDVSQAPVLSFPTSDENPDNTITFVSGVWTTTDATNDTYVATYSLSDADEVITDIDVQVAGALDVAGNTQVTSIESNLFSIDTENPTVTGVSASDLEITDVDLNSGNFTLTVTFSESMDVSQAPVLSFPTSDENPDNTITFVSGVWTTTDATNDTYVATYSLSDADEVITDIDVQVAGALDVAGNTQVTSIESNLFSIDTENPTATVILGEDSLSDSNNTTTVSITFTEVPTGFNPSEDLSVIGGTLNTGSFDASNKIWTATFTADDGITGSGSVALADDSYTDAVLNMGAGGSDTLSIDTENPTVTGVSASDLEITDVDLNSGNFTLTVTFSESMDVSQAPVLSFPTSDENPDNTITFVSGVWTTTDATNDTYVATYSLSDADEVITDIDVQVAGALDVAGNTQVTSIESNLFSIDTENPTVTGVSASDLEITDVDLNSGNFTLTVTFSESMDVSQAPVLSFPTSDENPDNTITFVSGVWTTTDATNDTYVATYSLSDADEVITDIDVQVAGALDVAGNTQVTSIESNLFSIDTENPTATVILGEDSLSDSNNTTTVSITFTEVPTGFNPSEDLSVIGGTLNTGSFDASNKIWTATFTADDGITGSGSVALADDSYTDAVLNMGAGGSDTLSIDTENPTATVALAATSLSDSSNTTTVSITFTEVPTGFDPNTDLTVTGGSLGAGSFDGTGLIWTATYTADDGITGTGSVALADDSYTDAVLNMGAGGSDTLSIDTENPTATVALAATSLSDSNNTTTVSITFSEVPTGFNPNTDLSVTGGTLNTGSFDASNKIWTATFTADDGITGTGSVALADDSYTDAVLNMGAGGSDTLSIDTENPTATVALAATSLSDSSNTTTVSITFTEVPTGFNPSEDLSVIGGTLNTGSFDASNKIWTATFTADDGITGTGSVALADDSYTDAVLNMGAGGSDTLSIDTENPTATVALAATSLSDSSNTTTVSITFTEVPTGFDPNTDLTVTGGSLGAGSFDGTGLIWTATYTADDGITGTGSVALADDSYTDAVLNMGAGGSDTLSIDTENPTATVALAATSLSDSNNTTTVSITFSEVPTGFNPNTDLSVTGGTLNTGSFDASNKIWTATYTADDGITGTGSVALADDSYTDAVLNMGAGGSDTLSIDTENPTATVALAATSLSDSSNTTTVSITFTEVPTGFDPNTDLTVTGGSLGAGSFDGTGLIWTATYTADDGITGTGSVALADDSYTDAVLNMGAGGSDTLSIDTENPTATVALAATSLSDSNNTTTVSITFSEVPTGFNPNTDLSVTGGTLNTGSFDASNKIWTATFTADDGITGTGSVALADDSYTDAVLNMGAGGSDTLSIDTENPTATVALAATSLSDSSNTTTVSITFTEVPTGFDPNTDLSVTGGSLGAGSFDGTGLIWTATFTADDGITGTGSVALADDSYTDAVLNMGTGGSDTLSIDTENPTATVILGEDSLSDSNNTTTVSITFTEVPTGFDPNTDLTVTGGTLNTGSFDASNKIWTATFTADDGITGTGSVALADDSYTDAVLNMGTGGSDTLNIDTENPTVTSIERADADYTNAEFVDFTLTFSENVTEVDTSDFSLSSGTTVGGASIDSVSGSGSVYTISVRTGEIDSGLIGLAFGQPSIQDSFGNALDLANGISSGVNESYTIASTEVLLTGGDVSVADIRDATVDDLTLSVVGGNLVISSSSDAIAVGVGVTRINVSSVSVALADITGSNGVSVSTGGLDDIVTVEGVGRRLYIDGGSGNDTVQFQANAITTNGGDLLVNADFVSQDANASIDADAVSLTASGGDLELNAALSASSDLLLDASGEVSQTLQGVVFVAGDTTVSANAITLSNTSNDFGGAVSIDADGAVEVVNSNDLTLGETAAGSLAATASGDITGSTDISIVGAVDLDATGDISLQGSVSSSSLAATASGSINGPGLVTSNTVDLNASSGIGNTNRVELSSGNITADTASGNIEIANNLDTAVSVSSLTTGLGSVSFSQSGGGDLFTESVIASSGVVLSNSDGFLSLAGTVDGSSLDATASGSITDGSDGGLTIEGLAKFTASSVELGNNPGNSANFGTLTFASGGSVAISEASSLDLVGINTGGSADIDSVAGVSDAGATSLNVTGLLDVSGTSVVLGSGTFNAGSLTFASGGSVAISEASSLDLVGINTGDSADIDSVAGVSDAGATSLNVTGLLDVSGTSVVLGSGTFNAGSLTFASGGSVAISEASSLDLVGINTGGSADIDSVAGVSDAGATSLNVTGLLDVSGTSVVLGSGTFNAGSLTFASGGSVAISEASSLDLVGINTGDSADIDSVAGVSDAGATSLNVTGLLDVSGTSVVLGSGTFNAGSLTFASGGSVAISEASSLDLVGINTGDSADIDSVAGVSDAGATSLNVAGLLDVSGTSVVLGSGTFNAGSLTFASGGSVAISEASSLDLVGINTGGSADIDSVAGVSDAGATSLNVTGLLDVSGTSVVLGSGTFNAGSLTFASGGSVAISEASSLDLVGINTGGSADIDSVAGVSDAGATSLNVTGLLDVSGTSVVLGSGTFNAGSLTFASGGSVAISEASSLDLVGINTGDSADIDSVAGVSDAGATSLNVTGLLDVSGTSVVLGSGTFNAGSLTFASGGSVAISEASSLDLVGINTGDSADIDSVAGVSDAGATSLNVTGLLDVSGTSVVLGSGTFNAGSLTFASGGSVEISEDSSLHLVGVNTAEISANKEFGADIKSGGDITFEEGWEIQRGSVNISQLDSLIVSDQISDSTPVMVTSNMQENIIGANGEINFQMAAAMEFDWGGNQGYGIEINWRTIDGQDDIGPVYRLDSAEIINHQYLGSSSDEILVTIGATADFQNAIKLTENVGSDQELVLTSRKFDVVLQRPSNLTALSAMELLPQLRAMPDLATPPQVAFQSSPMMMPSSTEFIEFESSLTYLREVDARWIEIRLVDPIEGETTWMSEPAQGVLDDANGLSKIFKGLPDEHFKIYLILEDGSEQKIFDVLINSGEPTPVSAESPAELKLFQPLPLESGELPRLNKPAVPSIPKLDPADGQSQPLVPN